MDLEQTIIESVRPIIVEEVRKQMNVIIPSKLDDDDSKYVDSKFVCELLHITQQTRVNYNKKGILRPRHIGSRVLYVRSEVMEAVESGKLSRYSHQ